MQPKIRTWGYFSAVAVAGVIASVLLVLQSPPLSGRSREKVAVHLKIIRAQKQAIDCLQRGGLVDDCEARLERDKI